MASTPQPDSTLAHASSRGLPGAGRVLVVDDDESIREVLEVLISIEGCDVRSAPDGASALELVQTWTPDLILLDLTLAGMSGEAFIAAYQATPKPHAPIILMTGRELSRAEVTELGATGALPKPFDVNDLLDVVASFADCDE